MKEFNGPWRITFDTNPDDCNLSCIMCEDHSPYSSTQKNRIHAGQTRRRMPIELIRKIVAENKPFGLREIIPSTMGEPLLYKQFPEIVALCTEYDVKLNLTTNGTFPIKGAKTWAELIVPVTSDVKISWNGATKDTQEAIMRGTKWEKMVDNVREFIKIRNQHALLHNHYCRVTFQLTFLEENIDELSNIIALAIDLGVDRVKGHHLWAHFKEIKNSSLRRNTDSINRWNKAVESAHKIAHKKILLENITPIDPALNLSISQTAMCPFLGKEAWIAHDGRLNPCCAPDEERKSLGDFGNVHEISIKNSWDSQVYQSLQKNYQEMPVCQRCNMRK
jgi:MoaA/NifB/PqqE/SkfB family radical SAM enzyme